MVETASKQPLRDTLTAIVLLRVSMANRLLHASSLYLRKHAHNPIDWWTWEDAALQAAADQNKPIFLSIGYSSCHWCTVMEGEAFSDPEIAAYLNAYFLPIKVDREERPDLDSIYMQALQTTTGQGGWPLNIFLTPGDRVPFYGGTYFPVEPRYGRPGFLQLLQALRRFYDQEIDKLQQFKTEILQALQSSTLLPLTPDLAWNGELLYRGMETSREIITRSASDFGRPSFPMIPYTQLVLQGSRYESQEPNSFLKAARQRGDDLALGGIFDHVAGGFHRYTVDSTWTVPHFEKMLYDNGQIVEFLANLWSADQREPAYQRAIAKTVQWLEREMTAPAGYFYAAQDADNFAYPDAAEPEEGEFYVWDFADLTALLTDRELNQLCATFTLTPEGNFEGKNVLQRRQGGELSPELEQVLDRLFAVRYGASAAATGVFPPALDNQSAKQTAWSGRIPPVTDTKLIVAWNSLMISGLARAAAVFRDAHYYALASRAAQFICDHQWYQDRLHRLNYGDQPTISAQSEDYAYLIKALLDLQAADPTHTPWLEKAIAVQEEFDHYCWSIEQGGYFNTARDDSQDLLIRERSYMDNATSSANGIAITNLIRLSHLTENLDYLRQAEQGLAAFASVLTTMPQACPSLFVALDHLLNGSLAMTTPEQVAQLVIQSLPTVALRCDRPLPEGAIGVVCRGLSCLEPASSQEMLMQQIHSPFSFIGLH
jgi:hypothetical protein